MADNATLNAGTGGITLALDDIGGVHHQRVKISQGADGSATDVSSAAPLQVSLANHAANATAVKVDGSAVTQPVSLTSTTVTGAVAVTNAGLTEVASAINASSQMDVNIAASGATVPVSLTSTTVTGTVAVTQSGTWDEIGINDSGNSITVDSATASNFNAQVVGTVASAAADSGNPVKIGGKYNATPPTLTDGNRGDAQLDVNGYLKVNVAAGAATGYTEGDVDTTITGTAIIWEDTSDTLRAVSAAKPLPVNVVAGGTSGTQYDEAATDSTITGTAILWEDTSDTLRVPSAAKPLPVALISGGLTPTKAATATLANVSGSASSVTLQASNSSRLRLDVMNDSTAILYVKYGSTASATSFTRKLEAGETLVEDLYTGIVTGIWASATGSARMTELTT